MRLFMTLLGLLLLLCRPAAAQQQVDPHDQQALTFYFHSTPRQEAALDKYARADLDKAVKGGHPVEVRVCELPGMIVISLESVGLCDIKRGCPVLVFRDITKPPVLQDYAYQNMSITDRKGKSYLILRGDGDNMRDCLIPTSGRAKCSPGKPPPPKKWP